MALLIGHGNNIITLTLLLVTFQMTTSRYASEIAYIFASKND